MEVLEERFTRPEPFDLETYWTQNIKRFETEHHPNRATLRLSPTAIQMMEVVLSPYACAGIVMEEPGLDGWRVVTVPMGSVRWGAHEFLRFGPDAEVLGPPELHAHMTALVAQIAKIYLRDPQIADMEPATFKPTGKSARSSPSDGAYLGP